MKTFLKLSASALLLSSVLSFGGCTTPQKTPEEIPMLENYSIVYPAEFSESKDVMSAIELLEEKTESITGGDITVTDDSAPIAPCEILVGNTNRSSSSAAASVLHGSENTEAFVFSVTANEIVIYAETDSTVLRAIKHVINNIMTKEKLVNGKLNYSIGHIENIALNTSSLMLARHGLFEMEIELTSNVFGPKNKAQNISPNYGTITVLEHSGANNGTMLATMNAGNVTIGDATGYCYKIMKSSNGGESWEYCGSASDDFNTALKATYCISTPHLYELPEDIGSFKAGTLLLAGVSKDKVKTSELSVTAIALYYSTDVGETWKAFCTVDKAGGEKEGVWEPFLICDSGRLYCFYSDDSDPAHDQKIAYKWTDDLVNWHGVSGKEDLTEKPDASTKFGEPFEAVACSDSKLRPGMASIAKMNNGKFILAYEMVGETGAPVYCKIADSLDNWGKASDTGKIASVKGNVLGTSPWIAYSPVGGENGVLFLGARRNARGLSKYTKGGTDLFLSFDNGNTWEAIANPIPHEIATGTTAKDPQYYRGYSPALLASLDGNTLYYLNTVGYKNNDKSTVIKFAKIRLSFADK